MRIKFSLKRLLLAVTLVCVVLLPLALELAKNRRQGLVIAEIESVGGIAHRVDGERVTQVIFAGSKLTDKQLIGLVAKLDQLPELQHIEIQSPLISDKSITHLAALDSLTELFLSCPITDASDESLARLKNLKKLYLKSEELTDGIISSIARLKGLEYLGLNSTSITDKGVQSLITLSNLSQLDVQGTNVSKSGLTTLGEHLDFYVLDNSEGGLTQY